ncbi:protein SPT2 homolog isoform X2 [Drosophila grimshawi]|uniref:Protein SPT2 homolog n=1 Tax=Drosophila grimshawi TaxID=7222 RepID=B4JKK3_DROGR|nr:protein SPT2 homolog isoform X2 [Drosophila grimshawi]EDW00106.1 GH12682 [Drosophila grimshawi]
MDFGALLHYAKKKNDAASKDERKFYSTKYAPPKKETKESKQLSNNIQKFLKNREAEEMERKRAEREKLNNLLAMRDEKSKNKIRKMLKVTKSANKSVLDDAKSADNTVLDGTEQPDGDDYGYVSTEANALYQKYIEKVKDVQEDKGFAPSRPQSGRDLSSTKERVKAAITREREEARSHTRQRTSHASTSGTGKDREAHVARAYSTTSSKTLYDPDAERRDEERKRREEEQKKVKAKRATQPPPMDFQALLRLAEKKQNEPVAVAVPEKKKEPERLMSAREKKEHEERQRWKEQRAQRDRQREIDAKSKVESPRMDPVGRIPKLNKAPAVAKAPAPGSASAPAALPSQPKSKPTSDNLKRPASSVSPSTSSSSKYRALPAKPGSNQTVIKRPPVASSSSSTKPTAAAASTASTGAASSKAAAPRNPYEAANKAGGTRNFPPREPSKVRSFPPEDVQRNRKPHPSDARARRGGGGVQPGGGRKPIDPASKRRIYDDDSEYDSALDDFIDDGDCEEDISSHIRDIFGYDKRRYRDLDEGDSDMESSFAQTQREEYISKKIGIQEDLEDMRMEAMHKKRKLFKKRSARIGD